MNYFGFRCTAHILQYMRAVTTAVAPGCAYSPSSRNQSAGCPTSTYTTWKISRCLSKGFRLASKQLGHTNQRLFLLKCSMVVHTSWKMQVIMSTDRHRCHLRASKLYQNHSYTSQLYLFFELWHCAWA